MRERERNREGERETVIERKKRGSKWNGSTSISEKSYKYLSFSVKQ